MTEVRRSPARRFALVFLDSLALIASVFLAFGLRFNFDIPASQWDILSVYLAAVLPVRLCLFGLYRLYSFSLAFISLDDLASLGAANLLSSALLWLFGIFAVPIWYGGRVPISVLALETLLTLFLVGVLRISKRAYLEFVIRSHRGEQENPTLVVGAGAGADQVLRYLKRDPASGFDPVALLDDDPAKFGSRVQGVRVAGQLGDLPELVAQYGVRTVLVAIPSASVEVLRDVYAKAQKAGVQNIQILRSSFVSGDQHFDVSVKDIRDLEIEDLLGRDPVEIDTTDIHSCLQGARVLVTGASGSIGSEIMRQVLAYSPAEVLGVDLDESGLFDLERGIRTELPAAVCSVEIADVRSEERMRRVFSRFKPTIVFHAAAYKHVPLMESFPEEAVQANIFGTWNVARLADQFKVERFIFVSTDKAVNPKNVMGASKRLAGRIVHRLQASSSTRYISVRFGNVLGSRGSVIPIFLDQLRAGGPLTVTHPDMVRYFMTIPEAVKLVLQAGAIGTGGEVFVLDMGEPMHIVQLAEEVIRMHGKEPYEDVGIEFIGMRPGEKLREELLTSEEGATRTDYEKIMRANLAADEGDIDVDKIVAQFRALLAKDDDIEAMRAEIRRLIFAHVPTSEVDPAC